MFSTVIRLLRMEAYFPKNKKTGLPLKTAVKYPYYINLPKKEYFYLAGIWTPWTDKNTGEYVKSFSNVNTKANRLMGQVHNAKKRMPTILNEDLAYEWIFGKLDEKRITEIATTQYPAEEMKAVSISKDFITALNHQQPFEYADLPALKVA